MTILQLVSSNRRANRGGASERSDDVFRAAPAQYLRFNLLGSELRCLQPNSVIGMQNWL